MYENYLSSIEKEDDPSRYYEAYQKLCSADGIIVPGGFGDRGVEGKISAINWARTHNKPFLGICLGMQLSVVEFCRNVLKWDGANSAEFNPETKYPVVISMPEHHTVWYSLFDSFVYDILGRNGWYDAMWSEKNYIQRSKNHV